MKGAIVKKGKYLAVALLTLLFSAVPRVLNYQGKLTTTSGEGINDTLSMTFRLYTSATGGEPLWSQTISNVPITRGLFSVELSGFPDSVDFSEQYWLEVEIDGEALSPREKLASAPYSLRSLSVEQAPNLDAVLTSGNSAGGKRVTNLGEPSDPHDAATMNYVDTRISSLPGGTGTENYVARWAGSSTLGTGSIYDNGTNVGIGTTSPSARLYVKTTDTTTVPFQVEALVGGAGGWLSGWSYRKLISLSSSSGAGTNYQVLLKVGESSGATGANFHVEGHSAIFPSGKNDSGDLRFTASDGVTLLNFWVENVTGTSPNRVAYCWVKVSADLSTNQSIYCYYGNPYATNVSNGDNTFLFFDDFEGSSLDTNKWTWYNPNSAFSYSVSNSEIRIYTVTKGPQYKAGITKANNFSLGIAIENKIKGASFYREGTQFLLNDASITACDSRYGTGMIYSGSPATNHAEIWYAISGDQRVYSYGNLSLNTYYIEQFIVKPNQYISGKFLNLDRSVYIQSSEYQETYRNWTNMTRFTGLSVWHDGSGDPTNNDYYMDWIFVRKYVSPEPAFSLAGAEETLPPILQQTVFYIENKTGNVGIGTTNPTSTLDVQGTAIRLPIRNSAPFACNSSTEGMMYFDISTPGSNWHIPCICIRHNTAGYKWAPFDNWDGTCD